MSSYLLVEKDGGRVAWVSGEPEEFIDEKFALKGVQYG